MGSQATQALLWGRSPQEWSYIQEPTGQAGYDYALKELKLTTKDKLLDVGCGSGLFASQALKTGAQITGLDATEVLIAEAKKRASAATFLSGEMEELPFTDASFDVVTGFNSFQYAASVNNAFIEALRVLKPGGRLVVMIWGNKEDCEAATYLKAVGSMLPPPPPGAPGPFALTENHLLETTLQSIGFKIISNNDIPTVWDFPDTTTALQGLLSAGPAVRAIDHSGREKVQEAITNAMQPYVQSNGHVVYHNKFRVVLASK
ncbi:MAG: class I SAM-dependent methyltransferase [Bacteroidetes bacterium]|nr:class I SAM-dependent methyltransferase [Bacteroidota bacterium]